MSDYARIKAIVDSLSEDEAYVMYSRLCARFGWAGTIWTREDVEYVWQNITQQPEAEMPDAVWQHIQADYGWRHLGEVLSESATYTVAEVVHDAIVEVTA